MAHRLLTINLILIFLLMYGTGWGQTGGAVSGGGEYAADSVFLRKLADEVLVNSQAYDNLKVLTKEVGPRLSGSAGYYKAEVWGKRALEESLGLPDEDHKEIDERLLRRLQQRLDTSKGKSRDILQKQIVMMQARIRLYNEAASDTTVKVWMQACMVPHWVRDGGPVGLRNIGSVGAEGMVAEKSRAEARTARVVVRSDRGADAASWKLNGSGAGEEIYGVHGLDVLALGNSVGTGPKGIRAQVILIHNFEELEARRDEVKGKIVFYNYPFNPRFVQTFDAYGDAVKYRVVGPSLAAKYGAVAVIVRSMSHSVDNNPHTGALIYNDSFPKVPAVAVGLRDADMLAGALEVAAGQKEYEEDRMKTGTTGRSGGKMGEGSAAETKGRMGSGRTGKTRKGDEESAAGTEVWGYIRTLAVMLPDTIAHNVIGEIKGQEFPNEYITIGGHLDSWDPAEGAMDDGTGCVQAIEVLRALKAMGYKPRHTIRAVLFANEENGGRGGAKYAEEAKAHGEKHLLGLESDNGGFTPRSFTLSLSDERLAAIQPWVKLLTPYGVYELIKGGGGSDVGHLQQVLGSVVGELRPDSQRYFDYHHSRGDVLAVVNKRELELGALNMAALVYLVDKYGF